MKSQREFSSLQELFFFLSLMVIGKLMDGKPDGRFDGLVWEKIAALSST